MVVDIAIATWNRIPKRISNKFANNIEYLNNSLNNIDSSETDSDEEILQDDGNISNLNNSLLEVFDDTIQNNIYNLFSLNENSSSIEIEPTQHHPINSMNLNNYNSDIDVYIEEFMDDIDNDYN